MDTVESVATEKQTLYKMTQPSNAMWLVAHNSKNIAHVVELQRRRGVTR
jgi:polyphosphate kinase